MKLRGWTLYKWLAVAMIALPVAAEQSATTADGRAVRLFDDGRWEYADEPGGRTASDVSTPAAETSHLTLAEVVVLRREKRRKKTVNVSTRTVFHLTVENVSERPLVLDDYLSSRFRAVSSSGVVFPVLGVSVENASIAPGGLGTLQITVNNSPHRLSAKHVTLEIAPRTVGNRDLQVLRKPMSEVRTRKVGQFPAT